MRRWFVAAFVANMLVWLVSLVLLPDQVAIHFSAGGVADNWASKQVNALLFAVIEIPLFLLFFYIVPVTLKMPARWISVPNRDYWLRDANRAEFARRFGALMDEFGFALFVFLLLVALLTLDANFAQPVRLNETLFLAGLVAFILYLVYWLVRLYRRLKPPAHPA